jgi:hypothetical protein
MQMAAHIPFLNILHLNGGEWARKVANASLNWTIQDPDSTMMKEPILAG